MINYTIWYGKVALGVVFQKKKMSRAGKLICVKKVKQVVAEEWDENMPLPGDIIEGIAKCSADNSFIPAKEKSELNSELRKLSREVDSIWLKVRRGDRRLKLRACIVQDGCPKLQRKFTFRAASDERHVAVLADLSFEKCSELQDMSRQVVNMEGFYQKGITYDWKAKIGTYLPDERSTIISSILFMPMETDHEVEGTTIRTMAWFSAAVSSGAPLVFLNIQTEQIIAKKRNNSTRRRQPKSTPAIQIVQGLRLWYLPGIAELPLRLTPEGEETRFGMDISRTDEGFVCVYSVTKGTAAERSGLGQLLEQANKTGHLVVISRLEGKSLMPSTVNSDGLIKCCDNAEIKETLTSAMERMDSIRIHIMSWPNQTIQQVPEGIDATTLRSPLS